MERGAIKDVSSKWGKLPWMGIRFISTLGKTQNIHFSRLSNARSTIIHSNERRCFSIWERKFPSEKRLHFLSILGKKQNIHCSRLFLLRVGQMPVLRLFTPVNKWSGSNHRRCFCIWGWKLPSEKWLHFLSISGKKQNIHFSRLSNARPTIIYSNEQSVGEQSKSLLLYEAEICLVRNGFTFYRFWERNNN